MNLDFITIYNALPFLSESLRLQYTNFIFRHKDRINEYLSFDDVINRLRMEEPIEYVFNLSEFCGLELYVDKRCLIPRPETEELVSSAIEFIKEKGFDSVTIVDVGTGSGCIPLALASELSRESVKIIGIEKSIDAIEVAKINNEALHANIDLINAPFQDFDFSIYPNLIVCSNLPYIPNSDQLQPSVANFEPHEALFGGENGDELNNQLLAQLEACPNVLAVFMEGYNGEITSVIRKLIRLRLCLNRHGVKSMS